eukprot:1148404-Pelagomonas_calceolata.AAC.2
MKELGCYTDGQRQEIDAADKWACPACAGLNNAQKMDRECQSREELVRVTGCPPGSLRKLKKPGVNSKSVCLNSKPSKLDLSRPTADSALSDLERQGFEKPDATIIWKQKLDT